MSRCKSALAGTLALGGLAALSLLGLSACGGSAAAVDSPRTAPELVQAELPALPQDGPYWPRSVSLLHSFDGILTYSDCGAPGAQPHATQTSWLSLDGDQASGFAWAVYQIPLAADVHLEQFTLTLSASGLNRYWLAYANYSTGKWEFLKTTDYPDGIQGTQVVDVPSSDIADEAALHSPGHFAYLAVLVMPGNKINVASLDSQDDDPGGPPPDDPIFDAYEDNDSLDNCYTLLPGSHFASVHQTLRTDMNDPNEYRDIYDVYCVSIGSGQTLTATLRFEDYDHFWDGVGQRFENDLDLLFYYPGANSILNDFNEQYSSFRIFYYPFEQVTFTASSGADYSLCVMTALGEGVDSNALYNLQLFVSDSAYKVSGYLTQNGALPTKTFVAFLEPGNFNAITAFGAEGELDGHFVISGVPDGTYTLKAYTSLAFNPYPYEWPETIEVVVNGGDSTGNDLDVGDDPPG